MTFSPAVEAAITRAAAATGVPLPLANAVALVESGGNPNASGDQGHSVGLYQLNDQGEGAGMTVVQLEDPYTNAFTALSRLGPLYKANPTADAGTLAAAAQRPADPSAYAQLVDKALYDSAAGTGPSVGGVGTVTDGGIAAGLGHGIADWIISTGQHIADFASGNLIGFLVAGVALYVVFAPDVAGTARV